MLERQALGHLCIDLPPVAQEALARLTRLVERGFRVLEVCFPEGAPLGHQRVFADKRLPASRCQVPVTLPSGRLYLDRLYDGELVNVELDGAAYHGAPGQRERDLRRDAAYVHGRPKIGI